MKTRTKIFLFVLTWVFILILATACKPIKEIQTVYIDVPHVQLRIDSVTTFKTDSFIQIQKGDTVYKSYWKTLYKTNVKIERDTVTQVKTLTINTETIKFKHDFLWWIGMICFGFLVLIVIYKVLKFFKVIA